MTKVVYNACYGGFGLSEVATKKYEELSGKKFWSWEVDRTDPILVKIVEEGKEAASDEFAELEIAEVPEGTYYRIDEYDGLERVMTADDYDWSIA